MICDRLFEIYSLKFKVNIPDIRLQFGNLPETRNKRLILFCPVNLNFTLIAKSKQLIAKKNDVMSQVSSDVFYIT